MSKPRVVIPIRQEDSKLAGLVPWDYQLWASVEQHGLACLFTATGVLTNGQL